MVAKMPALLSISISSQCWIQKGGPRADTQRFGKQYVRFTCGSELTCLVTRYTGMWMGHNYDSCSFM